MQASAPMPPPRGMRYQVIADQLREKILNGDYPQGGKLPSESDLEKQYGVSAPTVRQALDALAAEGLIVRSERRATYVRVYTPLEWRRSRSSSEEWRADMQAAGHATKEEVLVSVVTASTSILDYTLADLLELEGDDLVLARRLTRYASTDPQGPAIQPHSLHTSYIPMTIAERTSLMVDKDLDVAAELETRGHRILSGQDILAPRLATRDEADQLKLLPVTVIHDRVTIARSADNQPVLVERAIVPVNGARFLYDLDLTTGGAQAKIN